VGSDVGRTLGVGEPVGVAAGDAVADGPPPVPLPAQAPRDITPTIKIARMPDLLSMTYDLDSP
jgi:hypothetical protein